MTRRGLTALAALALAVGLPATTRAQHLFYTDTDYSAPFLRRVDYDGTVTARPLTAGTLPEGVAYDDVNHTVYWVESAYAGARILRTAPGLGPPQVVLSGLSCVRGIAVDPAGGKIYWTSSNLATGTLIQRAGLDGSSPEVLYQLGIPFNPRGIAVDPVGGKVYWAELELDAIARCDLDGNNGEFFVSLAPDARPYGVAVDAAARMLYWTEYGAGNLCGISIAGLAPAGPLSARPSRPARVQGGPWTVFLSGLANPTYMVVDLADAAFIWVEGGVGAHRLGFAFMGGGGAGYLGAPLATYGGIAISNGSLLGAPETPVARVTELEFAPVSPNPARGRATMAFALPLEATGRLVVTDIQGRVVATLAEGTLAAGRHRLSWDGRSATGGRVASGVYFARLEVGSRALTRRVVLLE